VSFPPLPGIERIGLADLARAILEKPRLTKKDRRQLAEFVEILETFAKAPPKKRRRGRPQKGDPFGPLAVYCSALERGDSPADACAWTAERCGFKTPEACRRYLHRYNCVVGLKIPQGHR